MVPVSPLAWSPSITPCLVLLPCACSPLLWGVSSLTLGTRTAGAPRNLLKCGCFALSIQFRAALSKDTPRADTAPGAGELCGRPAPRGPAWPRGTKWRRLGARHPCGQSRGTCRGLCGLSLLGWPRQAGHRLGRAGTSSWQRGWECPAAACSAAAMPRQVTSRSGPLRA